MRERVRERGGVDRKREGVCSGQPRDCSMHAVALFGHWTTTATDLRALSKSACVYLLFLTLNVMLRHDPISAITNVLLTLEEQNQNDFLVSVLSTSGLNRVGVSLTPSTQTFRLH